LFLRLGFLRSASGFTFESNGRGKPDCFEEFELVDCD
jgi:hypothetical protein